MLMRWITVKRITSLLLCIGSLMGAAELFENTDFSRKDPKGRPLYWICLNGTKGTVSAEGMTIRNPSGKGAVMTQAFRPRPGKRVLFSVEVKSGEACKVRAYLECEYTVNGKKTTTSSGAAWRQAEAGKWLTLSGELTLPGNYSKCYLAVWNNSGTLLLVRGPHAEIGPDILIRNADFSRKTGQKAAYWTYRGKMPQSVEYKGSAVRLADGFLIQTNLKLIPERRYLCSFMMRGGENAEGRCYVEWVRPKTETGKIQGQTFSTGWRKTSREWEKHSFTVRLSPAMNSCYIVLGARNQVPVEFKDLKIEEVKPVSELGGIWDLRRHRYTADGLELRGMDPPAQLRDIPVTPGRKYELSYQAQVLKSQTLSEDGGFFRLRSTVSPDGISGRNGNADILHGQGNNIQNRSHVFSVPADSKIGKVTFAVRGGNPGVVRLSRFSLKEIPVRASDFWNVKLLRPFYRDAFFAGDDAGVIEGEAESEGVEKLRITLQDEVFEIPVKGKITKFQIPFGLPEGKYQFRCEFLKNGKTERSFTKEIARYPEAANLVTVGADRKIKINGRTCFPIYMKLRSGFTEESLYFAARAGVNTTSMHISDEEEMLRRLDMAQKYGIKIFVYPSPPFKASGLPKFRENVKKRLTARIMKHPALLGYSMPDEPLLAGVPVPVIREEYRILREHDPYHPCWLNAAPRNSVEDLKPYGAACDILSVDVYPIPYPNAHSGLADKNPTCCGKYALRMNEAGCGKKAVFVFLQGMAWHECTSNPKAVRKPYPTRMESRFMAYDSLLNGGTGYWLWGTGHVRGKEFYRLLYTMTAELHRYSGLFAEGKQLADLKTSNPAVRCAVMEYKRQKYFFLLNLTAKEQEAEVPVQGKILDSDGGSCADGRVSLSPYEVIAVSKAALPPPQHALPDRNEAIERLGDPVFKDIEAKNRILNMPLYEGNANWIWFRNGQHGLSRCFAEKKFQVSDDGEKVTLLVSADDRFIVYLNGRKVAENLGWNRMRAIDLTKLVQPGENRLTILGIDAGAAPCGLIAELRAGSGTIYTDTTWKVKEAFKGDPVPAALDSEENAVIVAPFGKGPWGKAVRIFTE